MFSEAIRLASAYHDVIQYPNVHECERFLDPLRDPLVRLTWHRVSRGVVVGEDRRDPPMEPKEVREALGLSVTEMARVCGIHYMTWSKWEKGEQSPPAVVRRMFNLLLWLHRERLFDRAIRDLDDAGK